jgi:tetratricopeptide (TPR) repeat protein
MIYNFCKHALLNGGEMQMMILPAELTNMNGLCNPSIIVIDGKFLVNIRGVEYSLYHCEKEQKFQNQWGVLAYLHPENDMHLRTNNFLCELDPNTLSILSYEKIDTSKLDKEPLWEFIGLEDARLVNWGGKLALSGVRRDTTPNGEGRMELSVIENNKEVSRVRIDAPQPTYCEKNWMPIIDAPYMYVKWTNPTEVVKADIETGTSHSLFTIPQNIEVNRDLRGGSQVISYKDYYVAITHEVDLWHNKNGNKDGQYYHRFIVWDKKWNIVYKSDEFKFTDARIEFCCGLAFYEGNFYATFGFQDSTSYILRFTSDFFEQFVGIQQLLFSINNNSILDGQTTLKNTPEILKSFIGNPDKDDNNFALGWLYFSKQQFPSALSFFLRCAEFSENKDLVYESLIMVGKCLFLQGNRDTSTKTAFKNAIAYCPERPEAYLMLSFLSERRGEWIDAHTWTSVANHNVTNAKKTNIDIGYKEEIVLFQKALSTFHIGLHLKSKDLFYDLVNTYQDLPSELQVISKKNIAYIDNLYNDNQSPS